jgi:hypothetical protein
MAPNFRSFSTRLKARIPTIVIEAATPKTGEKVCKLHGFSHAGSSILVASGPIALRR